MSNRVPNIQIPAALSKKNQFKFTQDTVSTATFMQSQPDTYLWTVPFQDVEINLDSFTRCAPLNLPTFGRITMTHRAFFVRFKDIFEGWNEAYTRTLYISPGDLERHEYNILANEQVPMIPILKMQQAFLTDTTLAKTVQADWDIVILDSSQNPQTSTPLKLEKKGRLLYKVLNGLGYTLQGDLNSTTNYNALPLLAYCKILAENYYPSNWKNNKIYTDMISILKSSKIAASTQQLTWGTEEIIKVANFLEVANGYDQDYFVSSYKNHVAENDNPFPTISVKTDNSNIVQQSNTAAPIINNNKITENMINTLQRVTSYLKINSLAGADAINKLYAMFGYANNNNRAIHIGTDEYTIQVGDIISTADTQSGQAGASIGSYAGKGIGGSRNRIWKYKCDENTGIIIVVKTVTPHIGYVQGWDRHNTQINILDFWHPLFDACGDQSIAKGELFSLPEGLTSFNPAVIMESEFGKIPRFAHYKVGHDLCIGDFQLKTRNTGMNAWHMFREIGSRSTAPSTSLSFAAAADENQYLRIFQNNGLADTYEPFNCVSNYTIKTYAPMRKLWDDTCLDQLQHEGDGNNEFQPGGSKMY
jgi:hypothetical protein